MMANMGATSGLYHAFLETPVQLRVGALEINKNMLLWINDALMAVFFLLIGLEVKREMMQGSLATRRQAIFPVIAALGGMVVPALVYLAFNAQIRLRAAAGRFLRRPTSPLHLACWRCWAKPRTGLTQDLPDGVAIIDDLGANFQIIALVLHS